ncbi:membrane protease YdiL (CAAX protease family) [Actinocorallia herbida]|uniref:Membrane protease YdiL (CAAX protease family) n=1 Tax=Actinocorallia herbida TaxID=58109 RepID=A0A3N1CPH3_9ACTN|nr:CPBP family intramembrane glutamic endopeptidase [Actinocorallia herbida]ROO83095.1 membrane protease YdiL (CAAX protease family) [Actinocorallia herbida]
MEPPEDVPPPDREGTQDARDAQGATSGTTSWAPVDPGPVFGPPEPQASWPAEHTYPVQHSEPPPAVPGSGPEAPGYQVPSWGAPAGPGYRLPEPGGHPPAQGPYGYAPPPPPGYGGRPPAQGPPVPPPYGYGGQAPPAQGQAAPSPYGYGAPQPGAAPGAYPGQPYGGVPGVPGQPYATGAYATGPYAPPPGPGYLVPGVHLPVKSEPWLAAPGPGTPFHRMDRTRLHSWWRPLVGTLTLAALIFAVSILVFVLWMAAHWIITGEEPKLLEGGTQLFGGVVEDLAAQLTLIAVWLPLVPLVVWWIARRPAGTVVSVLGRMRWKWLGVCALVAVGYVVISYALLVVVTAAFGDDEPAKGTGFPGWSAVVAPLVVIVLLVPFQAAAEEFVFRGWLLQAIGGCTLARPDGGYRSGFTSALGKVFATPWPAIIISSAVFVAGHGYTGWAMLDIGLWAVTCGWLAVKTGGLEAPIALHVLNNLVAFAAPVFAGELDDALVQGGAPAYILLADVPPLIFFAGMVLWLRRRTGVAVVTPGEPLPPPKPGPYASAPQPGS